MKNFLRGVVYFISSTAYVWLLFLSAVLVAARFTIAEPTTIKMWLVNSSAYSSVVREVSKVAIIERKSDGGISQISQAEIAQAAEASFTPQVLQTNSENVIDSFYGWFKGNTSAPDFSLDLSAQKQLFAQKVTDQIESKIEDLPQCPPSSFNEITFDPVAATCVPKELNVVAGLRDFQQDLETTKGFLPQTTFTAKDIKLSNGRPIEQALSWAPKAYSVMLWLPWVVIGLALLSGILLVVSSSTKRKGAMRVGNGLLFSGALLLLSGLVVRPAFQRLNTWGTGSFGASSSLTSSVINPFFEQIDATYSRYNVAAGGLYVAVALPVYITLFLTRKKKHDEATGHDARHLHTDQMVAEPPQEPMPEQLVVQQSAPLYEQPRMPQDEVTQEIQPVIPLTYRTNTTMPMPQALVEKTGEIKSPPRIQG